MCVCVCVCVCVRACVYVQTVCHGRRLPLLFFMTWTAVLGVNKDLLLHLGSHKAMADITPAPKLTPHGFIFVSIYIYIYICTVYVCVCV